MSSLKKVAACLAVTALLGVAASPASAVRLPEGSGQPAITGSANSKVVVFHCQAAIELFTGLEFAPGTFPGNILLDRATETLRDVSPDVHHCPLLDGPPA